MAFLVVSEIPGMDQYQASMESTNRAMDYGIGVTSVAIALGLALLARHFRFGNVEVALFLFAVAVTAWCAGPGPAAVSVLLSIVLFDYFFVPPLFSLAVNVRPIRYFLVFRGFASLVAWFGAFRRRVERHLVLARNPLQAEAGERTQQASLLNLTHDSIFVRRMDFIITYWNAGAQELYGWAAGEAVGKNSQELLHTVFPAPMDAIHSVFFQRLHSADAFEGTGIGLATSHHPPPRWQSLGQGQGATFYVSAPKPQGHLWKQSANSAAS